MLLHLRRSVTLMILCTLVFGLAYAYAGTGLSHLLFRHQADGSLVAGGSTLIGQNWNDDRTNEIVNRQWFHGRPDADDPLGANGVVGESGASNLGPRSKVLVADTRELVKAWRAVGVDPTTDLVTTSGSGLDPDITERDALVQVPMVARARHLAPSKLVGLIGRETSGPQLGFLGGQTIDVLALNRALARIR